MVGTGFFNTASTIVDRGHGELKNNNSIHMKILEHWRQVKKMQL